MRTVHAGLRAALVVLTFGAAARLSSQEMYASVSDAEMTMQEQTMNPPTYESTVVGVHLKIWIMTQNEHKKMMEGEMKGQAANGGTDSLAMDAMMSGTHHIKLDVSDDASGKQLTAGSASMQVMSPTMKVNTVQLQPRADHFGSGLSLEEKGEYQFILTVMVDGVPKTTQFSYTVQ